MSDKFPYLARQINGKIAECFGKSFDHIYEKDADFINFLSHFSVETLSGEWLDKLGIIVGFPRPYVKVPVLQEAFTFDILPPALDGYYHGFSTTGEEIISGEPFTRLNGGRLDDLDRETTNEPLSDGFYRQFINAACMAKRSKSIKGLCDIMEVFVKTSRYLVEFSENIGISGEALGDILVRMPIDLFEYQEFLQKAFDKIYTTSPRVYVNVDPYFDINYIVHPMEDDIMAETGSDNFQISTRYEIIGKVHTVTFTVTLGVSLASEEDAVKELLENKYGTAEDIIIVVQVSDHDFS